jgi:hypothetical protein
MCLAGTIQAASSASFSKDPSLNLSIGKTNHSVRGKGSVPHNRIFV